MSVRVVAELGQCHQGTVPLARDMIYRAAHPIDPETWEEHPEYAANAVKVQIRDLDRELTTEAAQQEYEDPDRSFAHETGRYMEHRERLELSHEDHAKLYEYAREHGLDFIVTACQPSVVSDLPFTPDAWKVASRDLTNGPLLNRLAETGLPVILSTGMADRESLEQAAKVILEAHGDLSRTTIMQCTSTYPCPFEDANLMTISWLRSKYPTARIGFSDHTEGVQAGAWAVMLGAEVIEAHMTPSRALRGGDHKAALSIGHGFWRYVRNIRNAEKALGRRDLVTPDSVEKARRKLERSIAFSDDLEPGTLIGSSNTELLSPGTGIPWTERDEVFGRRLAEPAKGQTLVSSTQLEGA